MENPFEILNERLVRIESMLEIILKNTQESDNKETPKSEFFWESFLRVKDVCKMTKLSKHTIYSLTSKNAIPYYKKGRILWFDKEEIEEWIREGRPSILKGAMRIIRQRR